MVSSEDLLIALNYVQASVNGDEAMQELVRNEMSDYRLTLCLTEAVKLLAFNFTDDLIIFEDFTERQKINLVLNEVKRKLPLS